MTYPEAIPSVDPFTHFWCSTSAAHAAKDQIDTEIGKLTDRVENIIDKVRFEKTPFGPLRILEQILTLSRNKDELELLGKALIRIAPIVEEIDTLSERARAVTVIRDNASWFASVFGDFSSLFQDIDETVQHMNDTEEI